MTDNFIFAISSNGKILLWEIKANFPQYFLLCLNVKDLNPAAFHIIYASAAEPSFTIVISLCAVLASWHLLY